MRVKSETKISDVRLKLSKLNYMHALFPVNPVLAVQIPAANNQKTISKESAVNSNCKETNIAELKSSALLLAGGSEAIRAG